MHVLYYTSKIIVRDHDGLCLFDIRFPRGSQSQKFKLRLRNDADAT